MFKRALFLGCLIVQPAAALAETQPRIFVVRERAVASLLDGAFEFKVLKIRGYTIDVTMAGNRRALKIGDAMSPDDQACKVVFTEIATETRLARFETDCF